MRFPIAYRGAVQISLHQNPRWPVDIPMAMVEPHSDRIRAWYGSSPTHLAKHGGLSPSELLAIVSGDNPNSLSGLLLSDVIDELVDAVERWEAERGDGEWD